MRARRDDRGFAASERYNEGSERWSFSRGRGILVPKFHSEISLWDIAFRFKFSYFLCVSLVRPVSLRFIW